MLDPTKVKFVKIKIKNWKIPSIIDGPVYNINLEISNRMQCSTIPK